MFLSFLMFGLGSILERAVVIGSRSIGPGRVGYALITLTRDI